MDHQKRTARKREKESVCSLLDVRSDMLSGEELHSMMEGSVAANGANQWMLVMGILMASTGLTTNSIIVIIGAKLISPLMGGILAMGYAVAVREFSLLRRAAVRLIAQAAVSLMISAAYFTLFPIAEATSTMIALAKTSRWDVMAAIFGGIAASIGNTRKNPGNAVPGAAIAVALMPPLCTAGYGIATGQIAFLLGAFGLFAVNVLLIACCAFSITKLSGVPQRGKTADKKGDNR